ncbi:hypothetical protein M758_12G004200 [Ceratodon purpureus]|nr:hypothetical protein M758_12G004200 [Ceratodon purpureus]
MESFSTIVVVLASILLIGAESSLAASHPSLEYGPGRLQALNVGEIQDRLVCRVSDFGARGDGIVYDTSAVQSTIDYCAERGGGVVHVPPGTYLTGTIYLKSNITLWVDEGATILGGSNQADFPAQSSRWYTILAEDAENVELTGGGIVAGQGLKFVVEFKEEKNIMVSWNVTGDCVGDECRPRLVGFINCKNVHVWNVFLEEPAYWCLHIVNSDIVSIHNVSIYGDFNSPNNDGIDIESSNNTMIENCHIDTGDDAICPKTEDGPLYNLTVTNCWIRTKSSAVKLGSGSQYDFRNLHFEHLTIVDSHRGLGIQLRDKGNVNNVTYANIKMSTRYYHPSWWGLAEPIYISACNRTPDTAVGSVTNVRYINITIISENGIFLSGLEKSFLKGMEFKNVNMTLVRSTSFPGGYHDYRPGCQGMVAHRMSGLFMEYVEDIWMQKVRVQWKGADVLDWGLPFDFTPSTVHDMHLVDFENKYVD